MFRSTYHVGVMQPAVSVIIPSYNHEAFVDRAISSALESGGDELEVIVVDDGSTDASRDRFVRYEDDPRVRIHLQDNRGAHAALNCGLELAEGDIAFILDSDDAFHRERVPTLVRRLADNPAAVLGASWIQVIDADGAELGVKQAWHTLPPWPAPTSGPHLSDLGDPRLALLETNWISTTSNLAFPMSLIRERGLRFSPLRYAHDWDFILSACALGDLELVEEPLVQYRVHGANTIGEGSDEGRGLMRFEIMWVVARHAARLLRSVAAGEAERARLSELLSASAPTFGCDAVFDQLMLLRGLDESSPAAYDALTDPGHPFTAVAVEVLQD
jgi:hypothetical protein